MTYRNCQFTHRRGKKTIVLTGASKGIGHATVKRFHNEGWHVITCSRHAFSNRCPWPGGSKNHVRVDLSDPDSVKIGIEAILDRLNEGPLNALVNNAAISPKGPGGIRLNVVKTDPIIWQEVFQVNFFSPILLIKGLLENLKIGKGSILNLTSIAGSQVHKFAGAAYSTSKAALAALTRELAADLGYFDIRVNAVAPGEISTTMLSPGADCLLGDIPLGRFGTPEEVASLIYFMCSENFTYASGAEIPINGGQHV